MATNAPPSTPDIGVATTSLSCRQCRARKVKCDRQASGCAACFRLGFSCSIIAGADDLAAPGETPSGELTQAGTKRQRVRRACEPCRAVKAKCSGTQPCTRCHSQPLRCQYREATQPPPARLNAGMPHRLNATPPSSSADILPDPLRFSTPVTLLTHSSPTTTESHIDNGTRRRYIDAYFDSTEPSTWPFPFLHKGTIITDWLHGRLNETLTKALCASGLHFLSSSEADRSTAKVWMQEVQESLFAAIGEQTTSQLQAMMLLISYRLIAGSIKDVWMLLPVAARIAFTKRLNYERPTLDPAVRESFRRLMWSIFWLDKLLSGGVDDLVVCPTERMHIRLPCGDYDFQCGLDSKAPHLCRLEGESDTDLNILGGFLRLYAIRERILRYTKRVIQDNSNPHDSKEELCNLDNELQTFRTSLPSGLSLSERRLILMGHSRESTGYIMLHTRWYVARSDLFRFLVPGIRESVSKNAMAATPVEYARHCQQECLDSNLGLCDLWSSFYRVDTRRPINDRGLPVSIYQCVKILDRLGHLLPVDGGRNLPSLRRKLAEAISLASHLKGIYRWVDGCLEDSERLLPTLGLRTQPASSRQSPDSANPEGEPHLRSKHSLIEANMNEPTDPELSSPLQPSDSARGRYKESPHAPENGSNINAGNLNTEPSGLVTGPQIIPTGWDGMEELRTYDEIDIPGFTFDGQDFTMQWPPHDGETG